MSPSVTLTPLDRSTPLSHRSSNISLLWVPLCIQAGVCHLTTRKTKLTRGLLVPTTGFSAYICMQRREAPSQRPRFRSLNCAHPCLVRLTGTRRSRLVAHAGKLHGARPRGLILLLYRAARALRDMLRDVLQSTSNPIARHHTFTTAVQCYHSVHNRSAMLS